VLTPAQLSRSRSLKAVGGGSAPKGQVPDEAMALRFATQPFPATGAAPAPPPAATNDTSDPDDAQPGSSSPPGAAHAAGLPAGGSIADRLARLQQNGQTAWMKRVSRLEPSTEVFSGAGPNIVAVRTTLSSPLPLSDAVWKQ